MPASRKTRVVVAACAALLLVAALAAVTSWHALFAQVTPNQNFGYQNAVGGISIDTNGLLKNATTDELGTLAGLRNKVLEEVPGDLNAATELRKVSLRRLEAVIAECAKERKELPDAVKFLAGLQRIRYVFVYPEEQDIVLVGPAEGWKVDKKGNVVGATTGRPVMQLDDLLVALRSARQAAQGGISCSIDPTSEGMQRLRAHAAQLTKMGPNTAAGIEQVLGLQQITVTGVPATSHFARVFVAADYRMKRIAMNFEPAPVRGLPSFLHMMSATGRGMSNMLPRWWLEPKYDSLLRDAAGLAWELRGASVKAMTEEDFLEANGNRTHTGKANPVAQKWADNMTAKYPELAVAEPVFGELQNCMDLAIVSALIVKERLLEKAGLSVPVLMSTSSELQPAAFAAPKNVPSQASVLRKGTNWVISASGGVLLNSWAIADKTETSEAPAQARAKAGSGTAKSFWWN